MPHRVSQRPSFNESANLYASGVSLDRDSGTCTHILGQVPSTIQSSTTAANTSIIKRKYVTIQSLIGHPICCGYLMQFCQSECNAESLAFVLKVDELRDTFAADSGAWPMDWKELDRQVMSHEKLQGVRDSKRIQDFGDTENVQGKILREGIWPSLTDKTAAMKRAGEIVQDFLSNDSLTQVCISEIFIRRTMKRIGLLHLYGPEVFEEACLEPIKTMRKDILPRFLVSEIASRMVFNVASCEPKAPPASDLIVPPPDSRLLTCSLELFRTSRLFDLDEVINCLYLYNEFFAFLKKCQSSENLICVRMIIIFEELISVLNLFAAGVQAWKIYQYFVAPGAAYEVSIHHIHRKHVMVGMAEPKKGMFDYLYRSSYEMLKVNFETFTSTDQYAGLGRLMREQKVELDHAQRLGQRNSFGCFGLGGGQTADDDSWRK